jgi:hypothetical protein
MSGLFLWGFQVPIGEFKSGLALKRWLKKQGFDCVIRQGDDPFYYYAQIVYKEPREFTSGVSLPSAFIFGRGAMDLLC